MKTKICSMFLAVCLLLGISSCGLVDPSTSSKGNENVTTVKMIKADIMQDSAQERQLRSVKRLNSSTVNNEEEVDTEGSEELENENSGEVQEPETSVDSTEPTPVEPSEPIVDGPQYVIIYKNETDITLTITLDNPEAYGIDALRVSCDDPEAKIQVEGEWKPIAQEADGTRVVNWSSEDPYEKTYNIRTTSLEDLYTFKVVDIRLAGQDKFLSKQTKSTDFGNNKLDIYKMDTDAYELDVVYNTFEEIKFGIKVKDGVTNLSNFKVDGKLSDEEGYWVMNESRNDVEISYDFELENGSKIRRNGETEIILKYINIGPDREYLQLFDFGLGSYLDRSLQTEPIHLSKGYLEIRLNISGTGVYNLIPDELWIGDTKLENVQIGKADPIFGMSTVLYCFSNEFGLSDNSDGMDPSVASELTSIFKFKIDGKFYKIKIEHNKYQGYEEVIDGK